MNCDKYREWILLESSGELSERKASELHKHLDECNGCRDFVRDCTVIDEAVRSVESRELLPHPSVIVNIRAEAERNLVGRSWLWLPQRALRVAAYAAMFMVIAGGAFLVRSGDIKRQRVETLNALVYLVSDEPEQGDSGAAPSARDIHDVAQRLLELDGFDISSESEDEAILSLFEVPDPTATQWRNTREPRA